MALKLSGENRLTAIGPARGGTGATPLVPNVSYGGEQAARAAERSGNIVAATIHKAANDVAELGMKAAKMYADAEEEQQEAEDLKSTHRLVNEAVEARAEYESYWKSVEDKEAAGFFDPENEVNRNYRETMEQLMSGTSREGEPVMFHDSDKQELAALRIQRSMGTATLGLAPSMQEKQRNHVKTATLDTLATYIDNVEKNPAALGEMLRMGEEALTDVAGFVSEDSRVRMLSDYKDELYTSALKTETETALNSLVDAELQGSATPEMFDEAEHHIQQYSGHADEDILQRQVARIRRAKEQFVKGADSREREQLRDFVAEQRSAYALHTKALNAAKVTVNQGGSIDFSAVDAAKEKAYASALTLRTLERRLGSEELADQKYQSRMFDLEVATQVFDRLRSVKMSKTQIPAGALGGGI